MHEQTFHDAEEHKKQADQHEKMWREKKEHEVVAWREKIHKEQDHWQHHMQHQMEMCKNDHQKEMEVLLHNSYLPKCAKSRSSPKWTTASSTSAKFPVAAKQQHGKNLKSRDTPKQKKKGVHFRQTASIHIIEEDDFEDAAETCQQGTAAEGADVSETKEDIVDVEHDGGSAVESIAEANEGISGQVVSSSGGEEEGEEDEEVKEEEEEEQGASVSPESLRDIATGVASERRRG